MIGQIKGGTEPGERAGYLALHPDDEGTWSPVDDTIHESQDQAVQRCARELEDQLTVVTASFVAQMKSIRAALDRLLDVPRSGDRVRVNARLCDIENSGAIVVPAPRLARAHLLTHVDDSSYRTLSEVFNLDGERAQVSRLIVDLVLEDLFDVLDRVERHAPDEIGNIARLAVILDRREKSRATLVSRAEPTGLDGQGAS